MGDPALGVYSAAIEHYMGGRWSEITIPSPGSSVNPLFGDLVAFGPSDVWAVGAVTPSSNTATAVPVAAHWDGSAWSFSYPEGPLLPSSTGSARLSHISRSSSTDLQAVGVDPSRPGNVLATHWDGTGWTATPIPVPTGAAGTVLTRVNVATTNDVWAVGTTSAQAPGNPFQNIGRYFVDHWDGDRWNLIAVPVPTPGAAPWGGYLKAVKAFADGSVFAVGSTQGTWIYDDSNSGAVPLILRRDQTGA
jgi:hypothetical protein